ncbi:MAG TPA: glucosaminidase domain-containing protein [bacterium]|jgi:flagellum-specific peptidoglycan hydrolase FlgJ
MPALAPAQQAFLDHVRAYVSLAESAGVPGAVLLAQAALESDWGRSALARVGNAYFGVKATAGWAGKVYYGSTYEAVPFPGAHRHGPGRYHVHATNTLFDSYADAIAAGATPVALFRAYAGPEENIRDYVRFFHRNPRYRAALDAYALTGDPRRFAIMIARAGYATAPDYARRLVAFMERCAPDLLPRAFRPITVHAGGRALPPDAVLLVNSRVFVHVRRLAVALGLVVVYDHQAKIVTLTEEAKR